jgi:hypothetical protein
MANDFTTGTIIGFLITTFLAIIGLLSREKKFVTVSDCSESRKAVVEQHAKYCPENRQILLSESHERDCVLKLKPIHDEIEKISLKIDFLTQNSLTMKNMEDLLERMIKRTGG